MDGKTRCWMCGGLLLWQGDFDLEEEDHEEKGIGARLECLSCGAEVTYVCREEKG